MGMITPSLQGKCRGVRKIMCTVQTVPGISTHGRVVEPSNTMHKIFRCHTAWVGGGLQESVGAVR